MRSQSMQDGLGDSKVRDTGPPDTRPCCHLLRLAEEFWGGVGSLTGIGGWKPRTGHLGVVTCAAPGGG